MENHASKQGKSRLMGKLFNKDKKIPTSDADVADFLRLSPSDKLHMSIPDAPPQPQLSRIDTSKARRWPTAAEINHARNNSRGRSVSPKRSRKGLNVRFTDKQPEIIGEGGDEAESPVVNISQLRRARSHPAELGRHAQTEESYRAPSRESQPPPQDQEVVFRPPRRTQTGFSVTEADEPEKTAEKLQLPSTHLDSNSFASRMNAQRSAEGQALRNSMILQEADQSPLSAEEPRDPQSLASSINSLRIEPPAAQSRPYQAYESSPESTKSAVRQDQSPTETRLPPARQWSFKDAALAVVDDALEDFMNRMRGQFQLYELSAQSVIPMASTKFEDWVTAAAWWFLRGRMNLESTVRDRQSTSEGQRRTLLVRQQAHIDLAKSVWIVREILPQYQQMGPRMNPETLIPSYRSEGDEYHADLLEFVQSITSNLRKLLLSMKRNNFFPPDPDEAPLLQGSDTSIWVKYPHFPQDIIGLLTGGASGVLGSQQSSFGMTLQQSFPLADTRQMFNYGRFFADAYLQEVGQESDHYRCPCVVSVNRGVQDKDLTLIIASQNGVVKLQIQSDKSAGPTWDDLRWRHRNSIVELKLPRGFILQIRCASHDFQYLYGMHDYTKRTHHTFHAQDDEEIVVDKQVKAYQSFDRSPQSQGFQKEPVTKCRMRLFELRPLESSSSGTLKKHAGFRLVVMTSPKTKSLNGVSYDILPTRPIQFGFLRGDGGDPALLLKLDDGQATSSMVITFNDQNERSSFHSTLSGSRLQPDENAYAHVSLASFNISFPSTPTLTSGLESLAWQNTAVLNRGTKGAHPQDATIVLSDALRLVMDAKEGTITDRVSVGPGGVRIKLSSDPRKLELKLYRLPQQDLSMVISEAQSPKDLPGRLRETLATAATSESIRTYKFNRLEDMHAFQAAATGFSVIYDGLASTFAITRRMMVVSIHKKWEASVARLQIVRREKIVQLLAFFEGFSHGQCMNFVLKGTDVFESSKSGGKYYIKMIDAKFALPRLTEGREPAPEEAFVCLDLPEYPSEHDDITVSFDTEAERERFAGFLPAPVKTGFRMGGMGSLKRSDKDKS